MPKKSVSEWESLFKAFDKDNSGTLEIMELRTMLKQGNCNMTDSQIADAFIYFDGDGGDRRVTLEEFIKGMKGLEQFMNALVKLFKQYDADGSGYVDKGELKKILDNSGQKFSDADVNQIMKDADKSGDGKISLDEFIDACT